MGKRKRKLRDKSRDRDYRRYDYEDRYRRSETPDSNFSYERYHALSEDENTPDKDLGCAELTSGNGISDLEDNVPPKISSVVKTVPVQEPVPGTSATAVPDEIVPEVTEVTEQSDVPQEILNILGEAKKLEPVLGDKVPAEISERWGKILVDGLSKEQKEALLEKMLIPENFLLAKAPKLNPEVAAVLTDTSKNRDKRLEKSQNQLGSGLAGLVNLTRDLIKGDMDKFETIKKISEISQLLLDLHYEETMNRRKLIVPLLDKKFWNTIQGVKRENFLFGDKLGENIKNTKDIEKSSQQIKKPAFNQPTFQRKPMMPAGNARGPPRQPNNAKTTTAAASRSQPQSSTTRRSTTQSRNRQTSHNKYHDRRHK